VGVIYNGKKQTRLKKTSGIIKGAKMNQGEKRTAQKIP
jgi:hypothetical protein